MIDAPTTRPSSSLHPWLAAAAVLLALASCQPNFKSGETRCSKGGACPSGFGCVEGVCVAGAVPSPGRNGGGSPPPFGMGDPNGSGMGGMATTPETEEGGAGGAGMGGAGGMAGMTGMGGMTAMGGMSGMTPAPTCNDPMFPKPCPGQNGATGTCGVADIDCSTLTSCSGRRVVCRMGQMANCMYPNSCSPIGNACTINPMRPQFCPASNGAGPDCWDTRTDCAQVGACGTRAFGCFKGEKLDCRFLSNPCSPIDDKCTDAEYPQFCPARGGAGPDCYRAGTDCNTVGVCNGRLFACSMGYKLDCTFPNNPCSPVDNKCNDPMFPKFCPAANGAGPSCVRDTIDCTTVAICEGNFRACITGERYDCKAKACVPK